MATETLPTVKVDDGKGGFYLINECDFDADNHSKYGDKPKATRKPRATKSDK